MKVILRATCFVVCCLTSSLNILAQVDSVRLAPFIKDHKYLNYLCSPSKESQAALLGGGFRYLYTPQNGSFHTSGFHLQVNLNLARFFTRKFIFGICYERKSISSKTAPSFSDSFIQNYNSYVVSQPYGTDSLRAYTLQNGINGTNGHGVGGNMYSGIGLCFSPFPQKYGGFMLEIKRGNRLYPFFGPGADALYNTNNVNVFLTLRKCYSAELVFKPFILFSSQEKMSYFQKIRSYYKYLTISLYYERLSLKYSTFNTAPLSTFVEENFIKEHDKIENWGIKIGFYLY